MPAATAPGPDEPRTAAPGRDGGGPRGYTGTGTAGCGTPARVGVRSSQSTAQSSAGAAGGERGITAGAGPGARGLVSPLQPPAQERSGGHPGRGQGIRPALEAAVSQMGSTG